MKETAYFSAGCFWGVEHKFKQTHGVLETSVGYMGGHTENPTYALVCSKKTGHAEVVQVIFDDQKISYKDLTQQFFAMHDPTQENRQGPDIGDQYRSEIFYTSKEQKEVAQQVLKETEAKLDKKVATKISEAPPFYLAEDYHQDYIEKKSG